MRKKYIVPELIVESLVVANSAIASYSIDDCVEFDGVTENFVDGVYNGYVYMNQNQLTYCDGTGVSW